MNITDETIETFKRAAFDRMMDDDGCPEGEQIRAGLAAVFAALRPGDVLPGGMVVEAGWQPMETVPKDGTEVRFADDYGTYSVWWVDGDWYFYGERPNDPYAPYVDPASERRLLPPKHWRPLPATPKGGA